jgi:hypothetical protein
VVRHVDFYNLDAAIAVGYRVSSVKATHFRIWATNTLRDFFVGIIQISMRRLRVL